MTKAIQQFHADEEGNIVELIGTEHDEFTVRRHNGETHKLNRETFGKLYRPVPEDTAKPKADDQELESEGSVHQLGISEEAKTCDGS